ncbi:MAG: hypothetical protein KZQ74_01300 [gamma proteobacterium symbiont of Bathyaustriella thionipta]|nr:hypothetical protein [gamma proteobacterium symbiont of Bathyaustriella thionipta]MCU7951524.1 hypothetical protein [gamma proteobacterium symbiont of Bathyaustriella thionipta]MCU7958097.1 hypothetical protein [gamma proteobacterium symbiont of Bathyaustriella thionipta]MCU7965842.1 hypothetical protein [gamma proteobacterium symbiont of Bathyaustriella thionipta]
MLASIDHGFLSSGKYIFNHGIMHSTATGVVDNEYNSEQALGITEFGDQIQLHPVLKPHWNAITPHYKRIGLFHSSKVFWELDIPEWTTITISTQYKNLDDIDIQDIEFNHQTSEGAIIVNWGSINYGKLTIMLADSKDYQEALDSELQARLQIFQY